MRDFFPGPRAQHTPTTNPPPRPEGRERRFGDIFAAYSDLHEFASGDVVEVLTGPFVGTQAYVAMLGTGQFSDLVYIFWPDMPPVKHGNYGFHHRLLRSVLRPEKFDADVTD